MGTPAGWLTPPPVSPPERGGVEKKPQLASSACDGGRGGVKASQVATPDPTPRFLCPASVASQGICSPQPSPAAAPHKTQIIQQTPGEGPQSYSLPTPGPRSKGLVARPGARGTWAPSFLPRSVTSPAPVAQAAASADLRFVRGSWCCRVFRGRHVPVLITGCLFISMETLPQLTLLLLLLLLPALLPSERGVTGRAEAQRQQRRRRHSLPSPGAKVASAASPFPSDGREREKEHTASELLVRPSSQRETSFPAFDWKSCFSSSCREVERKKTNVAERQLERRKIHSRLTKRERKNPFRSI